MIVPPMPDIIPPPVAGGWLIIGGLCCTGGGLAAIVEPLEGLLPPKNPLDEPPLERPPLELPKKIELAEIYYHHYLLAFSFMIKYIIIFEVNLEFISLN